MSVTFNQIKQSAHCVIQWLLQDNFKSSELLTVDQVPDSQKVPFIYTGYRPIYKPWKYYIQSIMHLHNETFNVWTHLIGFFIIFFHLVSVLRDYDVINDKSAWPILIMGFYDLVTLSLSAIAHLFHSKSPWHNYAFFMLDYAAIAANGYGTGIASVLIASSDRFQYPFHLWYILANVFMGWLTFYLLCVANTTPLASERKRKSLRISLMLGQAVFVFFPLSPRYIDSLNTGFDLSTLNHVTLVLLLDICSAISYTSFLPERWASGHCDVLGHSHQIFHVFIVADMLAKIRVCQIDHELLNVSQRLFPSLTTLALSTFVFTTALVFTYIYFIRYAPHLRVNRKTKQKSF